MTVLRRTAAVVPVIGLLLAGCSSDDDGDDDSSATSTVETTVAGPREAAVDWSYEGDTGPENWGSLSDRFAECSSGTEQSPIDLTAPVEEDIADIGFAYGEVPLALFNNGRNVEVEVEGDNTIEVPGGTYEVVQFHFHAGSEHAIDGQQYPMELHIVHASADRELAVVGVMLDIGAENAALAPVFDNLPTEVGEEAEAVDGEAVDLAAVLPDDRTYYEYEGSLTTPPCSEGVAWHILATPVEVSQAQHDAFTEVIDGNVRPLQPLGDRTLTEDDAD